MGLTYQSTGKSIVKDLFNITAPDNHYVIALAGNPNTGKSTVFNAFTGLRQHTGNWPGKTVLQSQGNYRHKGREYIVVDLPGTYSLLAHSAEEEVARDFICFAKPDVTVMVVDSTCLERNLNLVLQVMEITSKVIVCLNLIDEARRKKINIDISKLSNILGVPVVATAARSGEGVHELKDKIEEIIQGKIKLQPRRVDYPPEIEKAIAQLELRIRAFLGEEINPRWVALRLLEGDMSVIQSLEKHLHIKQETAVKVIA